MKWPWIARSAFDQLAETCRLVIVDRDRLRDQNDQLVEHLTRMDRVEHGIGEAVRPPRQDIPPMPQEIRKYVNGFASPGIRRETTSAAYQLFKMQGDWIGVLSKLQASEAE